MTPILPFGAGGDYVIARALRMRGTANAGLYRTLATTTNRRTMTLSRWFKLGALGSGFMLWQGFASSSDWASIYIHSVGALGIAQGNGGVGYYTAATAALFRDPTAWYHVVVQIDTTDATPANRLRVWINGASVAVTGSGAGLPALNADTHFNRAGYTQGFGYEATTGWAFPTDGLHAEIHFIDGTLVAPSAFGRFHSATGAWVPIPYEGGHGGANGARHDFRDASSSAALGLDYSGKGSHLTVAGVSVAAGASFDQSNDTPTNNHATINPLAWRTNHFAVTEANLKATTSGAGSMNCYFPLTFGSMGSGKFRIETTWSGSNIVGNAGVALWRSDAVTVGTSDIDQYTGANGVIYWSGGARTVNGTYTASWGSSWTSGDTIAMEWDHASGVVEFFKNGASQGSVALTLTAGATYIPAIYCFTNTDPRTPSFVLNCGQRPWAHTPTSGYGGLCTRRQPAPSIRRPADHMRVVLDTGANIKTASEAVFSGSDFLELIKDRANANNWQAIDAVRGTSAVLQTNATAAETSYSAPSGSSAGFVWKRGATPGFDIVAFAKATSTQSIAHALGAVPHLIVVKQRGGTGSWPVYHRNMHATPQGQSLFLDTTAAVSAYPNIWNNATPSGSAFSVGSDLPNGPSNYIAYLWTEIPGFSRIGAYTGNGAADGAFVWCGFRPRFILRKRIDSASSWNIIDSARTPFNLANANLLYPDLTNSEYASASPVDVLSSGFKMRDAAGLNAAGGIYVFAAFAETPFKYANAR